MVESSGSDAESENRIAALEKKINEIEALLNGLGKELQDLKSFDIIRSKKTDERSRKELKRIEAVVQGNITPRVVIGRSAPQTEGERKIILHKGDPTVPAEPQAPSKPPMDMIMQTDGKKKPEARRGNFIVASTSNDRSKNSVSAKSKQSKLN
jgi:hypothetical protein